MASILNLMQETLIRKETELKDRQKSVTSEVNNNVTSDTFERNLMGDLCVMIELKGEIKQLKHWTSVLGMSLSVPCAELIDRLNK